MNVRILINDVDAKFCDVKNIYYKLMIHRNRRKPVPNFSLCSNSINELKEMTKESQLVRVGVWVSIFGTLISAFFAGYSIYLTDKISKQQTEIKNLNEVIGELKTQNEVSRLEIKEVIKQTELLQEQASLSRSNNSIISEQFKLSIADKNVILNQNLKDFDELWSELNTIRQILYKYDSSTFTFRVSKSEKLNLLMDLSNLLKKGLNNSYIISNSKIYSYWYVFSMQVKSIYDDYLFPSDTYFLNGNEIKAEEYYMSTYSNFRNYFNTFWKNGVIKLLETEIFRINRQSRLKEANYGRADN